VNNYLVTIMMTITLATVFIATWLVRIPPSQQVTWLVVIT